jgi:hypothetical protein
MNIGHYLIPTKTGLHAAASFLPKARTNDVHAPDPPCQQIHSEQGIQCT